MKCTTCLLVAILTLFITEAQSQIQLGVKTGYTKAWMNYGSVPIPDDAVIHVNGYHVNGLAYYRFSDHFKIGTEPGYTKRGAACVPGWNQPPVPGFIGDTKFLLNYIEMPVLFSGTVRFFQKKLELSAKAGYGFSYLASAFQEDLIIGSELPPVRQRIRLDGFGLPLLNRWDHGIYSGLSAGYNFGYHNIFLESSYYLALTDTEAFNTSKNRGLSFSIGYLVSL